MEIDRKALARLPDEQRKEVLAWLDERFVPSTSAPSADRVFTELEARRLVELAVEAGADQENYNQRGLSSDPPPLSTCFEDLLVVLDREQSRPSG